MFINDLFLYMENVFTDLYTIDITIYQISNSQHVIEQNLEAALEKLSLWCKHNHTGQCKRTGGCYNELVVAFFSTGGGVKGKKIYTCCIYDLFINLHLFYL